MTTYTHRARSDFEFDPEFIYGQQRPGNKPHGLWLSVDGDWEAWLGDRTSHDWVGPSVEFSLDVDRCLHLPPGAITKFTTDYAADIREVLKGLEDVAASDILRSFYIDWPRVASEYAGVIVAPFHHFGFLQEPMWYTDWDVASACVWDLSAVTLLEVAEAES